MLQKVTLVPVNEKERNQFILDCQESFRYGSLEEFGERNTHLDKNGEVMPRSAIEAALDSPTAESYHIVHDSERVGGLIIDLTLANMKGDLTLLFTKSNSHSKGVGYAAWCEVERIHPEIKVWETLTPYFETRNIHFYVNRCGFHIVDELGGAFRFQKVME